MMIRLRSSFQKITHPPHPGRLLQYTISTGMLRALAVLQYRVKEQSTASNGVWGAHVCVSTTLCSFQVSRYSWIEEDHGRRGAEEDPPVER